MRQPIFFAAIFCVALHSAAQKNFSPGYLIKVNGDTLKGYLQEESRSDLLFHVQFKSNAGSSKIQAFSPAEVQAFRYETGDLYRKITFTNSLPDSGYDETIFALDLVDGPYMLFSYIQKEELYFVITGNNQSYHLYNSTFNGNGAVLIEGNYISRLGILASGCGVRLLNAEQLPYSEKDVSKFVFDLNNCLSPNSVAFNHYQKSRTMSEIHAFAGGIYFGKNRDQFTADVAVRLINPQLSRNAFINVGLHYSHSSHEQVAKEFGSEVVQSTTTDDIICAPLTIQYNFGAGAIQPFIYGGFAAAYLKETTIYTYYATSKSPPPDKFGISVIAALGVEGHLTNRFYLKAEWRYELILQYPAIGIGYNFK
ncbi:MAG TPA: hypothetical protein VKR32_13135 [Puia sp.]|nr:hypothetical protein [Puia sp.]